MYIDLQHEYEIHRASEDISTVKGRQEKRYKMFQFEKIRNEHLISEDKTAIQQKYVEDQIKSN